MKLNLGNSVLVAPWMVEAARNVQAKHGVALTDWRIVKEMLEAALSVGPEIDITVYGSGGSAQPKP